MIYPVQFDQWKGSMEAQMERFQTDITRLLRGQEHRFGPDYDRFNGAPGQTGAIKRYKLSEVLYRDQVADAKELQWSGSAWTEIGSTVEITADKFISGYWFVGDYVGATNDEISGTLIPVGSGSFCMTGTNSGATITKGSSSSRTLDNGKSVTLYATFEAITAGAKFICWWDDYNKRWHGAVECA